jgi:hypothetical protein
MPIECAILEKYPYAKESCPKCSKAFPEFMRGQVQSRLRKILGLKYCAIICDGCKEIIGWEKP